MSLTVGDLLRSLLEARAKYGNDMPVFVDTEARKYHYHEVDATGAGVNDMEKHGGGPAFFDIKLDFSQGSLCSHPETQRLVDEIRAERKGT